MTPRFRRRRRKPFRQRELRYFSHRLLQKLIVVAVLIGGIYASHWISGDPVNNGQQEPATIRYEGPAPRPRGWPVHDGDTFRIGSERIRILGMDAPEIGRGARCAREQDAAIAARNFLAGQLASGKVSIERHGHDVYGRTLARIVINGEDIADVMLSNGLARPYTPGRHPDWCD